MESFSRKNLLKISDAEDHQNSLPNMMITNHNTGSVNITTLPDAFIGGENLDEQYSALKDKTDQETHINVRKIFRNKRYQTNSAKNQSPENMLRVGAGGLKTRNMMKTKS
jgi:hypothetical protein